MFSTSGRTEARRVAGELPAEEVELRSTNGQECPFPHMQLPHAFPLPLLTTARNNMGPSAWVELLKSRLISAQPKRKTEIEKRS